MILRRLFKHRGLGINLIAGFSFLMLAVYGWGLEWQELGSYLLIILVFLGGLIGLAALLGWLLSKMRRRDITTFPVSKDNQELDSQRQNVDSKDIKRD
ncbi:MAG TPA: hypothetical protein VLF09_02810 [Cellvibrio sp.]|nr:hypothetical protein [Cellvibrio sp.]